MTANPCAEVADEVLAHQGLLDGFMDSLHHHGAALTETITLYEGNWPVTVFEDYDRLRAEGLS